jgi:DivIVA domain-containing protein
MDTKTTSPSFTVSLRGYDRMEVDEYLDSLAEALGQVDLAEQRSLGLLAEVDRQKARIADLERRINSEVPRNGVVLGERIAMLLRSAEETAGETLKNAEEEAGRTKATAEANAAQIIADAERRATGRTRQIEQWADQVISQTRFEEARILTELKALADQRDAVAANIKELRESLGAALGVVGPPVELPATMVPEPLEDEPVVADPVAQTAPTVAAEVDDVEESVVVVVPDSPADMEAHLDDEVPWPSAFCPVDTADDADFETKFDAWVTGSEGPQHFGKL